MDYADIAVLIPAYKPDERLVELTKELVQDGFRVVIVDDGSGDEYLPFFENAEAENARILRHEINRGKGAALRTGLLLISEDPGIPVITADSDGQHSPEDIRKIADKLSENPEALVLGMRDKSAMPPRSRAGNTITAFLFGALTGLWVEDTQTGLRGLPAHALSGFTMLEGDRYEYEMNMLLYVRHKRIPVVTVPISTIYFDNNRGSHFHTFKDGLRIYALLFGQILKFMGSSLIAGLVDTGIYTILQLIYPDLVFMAVCVARVTSSTINYIINRKVVFNVRRSNLMFLSYVLLVAFMLTANYLLITLFKSIGLSFITAKLLADLILFFVNYHIQQRVIFRKQKEEAL